MEFSETIREVYDSYLLYLDDGGERATVIEPEAIHIPGYVHAGALMDCPLKANKERTKAAPVLPSLAKRNNPTLLHRMQQGTRCAEPFQEAFVWAAKTNGLGWDVQAEYSVANDGLKLQGRIDLIVNTGDEVHIIEFKHRLPTWKDKFPQPRMGDVFQGLGYHKMTNATETNIVIINTPQYADFFDEKKGYTVWTLYKDSEYSDGYVLQDENMNAWNHRDNHGGFINSAVLEQEIANQLLYINGETTPPISLDNEARWQCLKITKYSKEGKVGIFHVQCPYFCHTLDPNENMPYVLDEDQHFAIL